MNFLWRLENTKRLLTDSRPEVFSGLFLNSHDLHGVSIVALPERPPHSFQPAISQIFSTITPCKHANISLGLEQVCAFLLEIAGLTLFDHFARFARKRVPKPQIGENYGRLSVTNRTKNIRNRINTLEDRVRRLEAQRLPAKSFSPVRGLSISCEHIFVSES